MVGPVLSETDIWKVLQEINDPEIPVLSIVDLKIVRAVETRGSEVTVSITPTFTGCPALDMIAEMIQEKLFAHGFTTVHVKKNYGARWSTDMLDETVRVKLERFGIAPPSRSGGVIVDLPTICPYCQSPSTQLENPFGATLCKQLYYCNSCRQSFEKFKAL
jgi:ring-1,2-phenylacetyl-CoA epoxidase subunit PaaD